MKLYIKKLRAEIAAEDGDAAASGDEECKTSDEQPEVTLQDAMEGCALLHQLLAAEREKVAELEGCVDEKVAANIRGIQQRLADLEASNAALQTSLETQAVEHAELRRAHGAALHKIANMEQILAMLEIPLNEKGQVREGYTFVKQGPFRSRERV